MREELFIGLSRKYKCDFNKAELQAVLRMLIWYIHSRDTSYNDIVVLANLQRAMKLGQRLQHKLLLTEKNRCKFTLNTQEASTVYIILGLLPNSELDPLDGVVVRKLYDVIMK
ncbi:hypothetical protein QYZ87_07815 [Porphyromonadaceae bacterium W3.11]|nr:hypothetical protein [Porphyromonadaceae bacterium W3.11]